MTREKFKFQMYERLAAAVPQVLDEARQVAAELGLPNGSRPTEQAEANPAPALRDDQDEVRDYVRQIRVLVKETYGDNYDACPVASTAIGLALCRRVTIPPGAGQLPCCQPVILVPRMKPSEMLSDCCPVPPKYRTVRWFGLSNEMRPDRLQAVRPLAVVVPLSGATYYYHGITPGPVSMIAASAPEASLEAVAAAAEASLPHLAAVFAMGTGVPGCGFAPVNSDGLPKLHENLGELASEYDVPFLVDNSPSIPFLGPDLTKTQASAVVFGPCGPGGIGVVIGTEDIVVPILEIAGMTGGKSGDLSPGATSALVAGVLPAAKDLSGLTAVLNEAHENPEHYARLVSRIYDTVTSEFALLEDGFKTALRFRKSYDSLSVEVNYEDTWSDGLGFPVFSAEDVAAGKHLLREGLRYMGVTDVSVNDASIVIAAPRQNLSTLVRPSIDHEHLKLEVQSLVALLRIISKHAGYAL